jgi:predicted transglutaminase-like cysteine proteinase
MHDSAIPATVLAQLHRDFTYQPDGALDTWALHRRVGPFEGDCEDFALALAWRLAGHTWRRFLWDLVSGKSVIWYCISTAGGGHAVLAYKGAGWADNMTHGWAERTPHRLRFPFIWPLLLLKLAAGPLLARVNRAMGRG